MRLAGVLCKIGIHAWGSITPGEEQEDIIMSMVSTLLTRGDDRHAYWQMGEQSCSRDGCRKTRGVYRIDDGVYGYSPWERAKKSDEEHFAMLSEPNEQK